MRDEQLVFGLHAVEAALRQPGQVVEVWLDGGRQDQRIALIEESAVSAGIRLHRADRRQLDSLAGQERHQGVVARVRPLRVLGESDLERILNEQQNPFFLVLDGVQDPHNLGACLRTADGAGVSAVIAPKDRAVGLTATVRKVASGAAESVPFIQVTNLARTLRFMQEAGVKVVGTAGEEATLLFEAELTGPLALVFGAEGKGLRRLTREHCDLLVRIPMQGSVESLNVSVAAGICLYEAVRQRLLA